MKDTETEESIESSSVAESAAAAAPASDVAVDVPAPAPLSSAEIVDVWFTKHFHNMSALFDERSYTHLLGAKEDLKVLLAQSH